MRNENRCLGSVFIFPEVEISSFYILNIFNECASVHSDRKQRTSIQAIRIVFIRFYTRSYKFVRR